MNDRRRPRASAAGDALLSWVRAAGGRKAASLFAVALCGAILLVATCLAVLARVEGRGILDGAVLGSGNVLVLEGEEAPVRVGGSLSPWSLSWRFAANGYLGYEIIVPTDSRHLVSVDAAGDPMDGVGPQIQLRIDGGTHPITHEIRSYWATYDWTVDLTAGIHRVEIAYVNDDANRTEDRSCSIDRVTLRSLSRSATATVPLAEPFWREFAQRARPAWFDEARFGIFLHWGVYSVPAYAPEGKLSEWYWYMLRKPVSEVVDYHRRTFGSESDYRDLATLFTAAEFDPAAWAQLFKQAGAKYAVLTARHADGYCLWPAPESGLWNSVDTGPGRDLCGEFVTAMRAAGIRPGLYYSLAEWFDELAAQDPRAYFKHVAEPQLRSLVSHYDPHLLWADGAWSLKTDRRPWTYSPNWSWALGSPRFLKWATTRRQANRNIVFNDRWGAEVIGRGGDFYTLGYSDLTDAPTGVMSWEAERMLGTSWGYKRGDRYISAAQALRYLVEVASRGGNLLLNVGPDAQGRIPPQARERLLQIGKWLRANGTSIYGTQAGPVHEPDGPPMTQKGGRLFVFVEDWPADGRVEVTVPTMHLGRARILSTGQSLRTRSLGHYRQALILQLPKTRPTEPITVIEVAMRPLGRRDPGASPDTR